MVQVIVPALLSAVFLSAATFSTNSPSAQFKDQKALEEVSFASQNIIWVVKPGESLASIAESYYGNKDYWTTLWNDNSWIEDPNYIQQGWTLKLENTIPPSVAKLKPELAAKLNKPVNVIPQVQAVMLNYNSSSAQTGEKIYPQSNFDEVYKEAGAQFGVPWQILYGIHLTETGLRNGPIFNSQGSGARGPMQFMPGTFAAYKVQGHENIDNAVDAIYAAANFIARHGSIEAGLRAYGGNMLGVYQAARSRGYNP